MYGAKKPMPDENMKMLKIALQKRKMEKQNGS